MGGPSSNAVVTATASVTTPTSNSSTISNSIATATPNTATSGSSVTTTYPTYISTDHSTSALTPSSSVLSSTLGITSETSGPKNEQVSQKNTSGSGYSTGALAGSIVGSFLGGLIIAFLIAFLVWRHRKRTSSTLEKRQGSLPGTLESPKDPNSSIITGYKETSHVSPNVMTLRSFDLTRYVPEPADDITICMRIQTFFDQAGLHIDNYYSRSALAPRLNQEDTVRINDYDSPFLGASLVPLLSSSRNQRVVLTHILIHTLLQSIRPGNETRSLLPACYSIDWETRENLSLTSDDDRAAFAWRMLTSYLTVGGQTSNPNDLAVRNEVIDNIADDFNQTFEPYGDSRFSQMDRLSHLHSVVREASRLGIWLLSQPCSFEFHWSMASKTSHSITLLPSVIKIHDEQGRRLAVPQIVLNETKAQI